MLLGSALAACGPKSHTDKSKALIARWADSLALDFKIVSLAVVDTIYTEMPENDSTYLAFLKAAQEWDDRGFELLRADNFDGHVEAVEKMVEARESAKQYKYNYKGELIGYAYELIVKSENYEIKKRVEDCWFIVNPEGTKFTIEEANFQENERLRRDAEELRRMLNSFKY